MSNIEIPVKKEHDLENKSAELVEATTIPVDEALQSPKKKRAKKSAEEKVKDVKEPALKSKRAHVMTEKRQLAFKRCTEARAANIAKRRAEKAQGAAVSVSA